MKSLLVLASAVLVLGACARTSPMRDTAAVPYTDGYDVAVLVAWNQRVLAIAEAEDGFLTLKGVRTAAMMHVAMHDALNSIQPRYAVYVFRDDAIDADPVAATAQAGFEVAIDQYPDKRSELEKELQKWFDPIQAGPARARAVAIGKASASAILGTRRGDGWDVEAEYAWHPMGPGVYAEFREHSATPQGFVFGAGWATVKPFMLRKQDQFRSPPPPLIDSAEYARAYDEVKEAGRFESGSRTPEQTRLAMWWKDFAENSHNRLARQLVSEEKTDLWTAARMFALLNMSISDGYISVFENKFFYNHWRPYTAIRWAGNDGNPATEPEPQWDNTHRHTYAFPSYPSAHGTVCAAAMTVLAETFGDERSFTMSTPQVDAAGPMSAKIRMDPPTRTFDSFSSAARECAVSRVYLGIHFRYDSIAGNQLGTRLGHYALDNFLAPIP